MVAEPPYAFAANKVRTPAGGHGNAIDDAGVIAGEAGPVTKPEPVRWASADAQPRPLALLDGHPARRSAIGPTRRSRPIIWRG